MEPRVNIPHAASMHWLDSATLSEDGLVATARHRLRADHPFLREGRLLPAALIELMAQAAAAGSAMKGARENRVIRKGVLAAMRDFRSEGSAAAGCTIVLTATHERTFGALSMAKMEAHVDGRLIASARMTFHLDFE